MHDGTPRHWRIIAEELSHETDSKRMLELSSELNLALDSQSLDTPAPPRKTVEQSAEKNGHRFQEIVDVAVTLMRSHYASLQMLFPERGIGGELRLLAFRGFNPEAASFWKWVRADSKSTCGLALRDGRRVVASDIANCDFMADSEDRQVYLQTGIHACQTTPLVARPGNIVGMISTHWRTPHQPSPEDFRQFDILAGHAADLIERSREEMSGALHD
ncbi:MAG TPA: GAF domain-containing protein [Candidatus Sulfotelmatobacter sp.]|nr:GAF domain-containing protein [Candidatus Sulfotelmatobacter sp.]